MDSFIRRIMTAPENTRPLLLGSVACVTVAFSFPAVARDAPDSGMMGLAAATRTPTLVISDEPVPLEMHSRLYSRPEPLPEISPDMLMDPDYFDESDTVVGRKVDALRKELITLQTQVSDLVDALGNIEENGQAKAAEYYANVATISTQLQSGTTPGNPRLVKRLSLSQQSLEGLANNVARLNDLAMQVSHVSSMASFLLEAARATYSLSGAVEEDHARLARLEDSINNTMVVIDRLLNNVNDDITRTASYLATERTNLRTMALAVTNGDLYGKSLANRPFSGVTLASLGGGRPQQQELSGPRPLVKIRFDKPDVAYEQAVYMAVREALERYPRAQFELIAVHPTAGNAAQVAIESTKARRNAEKVLRTLTQMGMPLDRIDLSYSPSPEAKTNEVHLYIR